MPPTSHRGCWHVVSRDFLLWYCPFPHPTVKGFTTRKPSSPTRRCCIRVSPIVQYSSLLPPVGVWAVLNPSVADHPLRPATDPRLGGPLPHQLANRPQAHLKATRAFLPGLAWILCGISCSFEQLSPTLRQITYVLLTRPPLTNVALHHLLPACMISHTPVHPEPPGIVDAFDLHVSSTPPAFILSQDQTLHEKLPSHESWFLTKLKFLDSLFLSLFSC